MRITNTNIPGIILAEDVNRSIILHCSNTLPVEECIDFTKFSFLTILPIATELSIDSDT
jgi:hypothetical protein